MQRLSRLSVRLQDALVKRAKSLKVGNGAHKETDVGPLISPEAKARAVRLITEGIHQVRQLLALQQALLLRQMTCMGYVCDTNPVRSRHSVYGSARTSGHIAR